MADYISREAAIDAVDVGNLHRGIVNALQAIISDIPAADVRPVVHGTWLWYQASGHGIRTRTCSVCGQMRATDNVENFCPNCGADMRGVDADGEG